MTNMLKISEIPGLPQAIAQGWLNGLNKSPAMAAQKLREPVGLAQELFGTPDQAERVGNMRSLQETQARRLSRQGHQIGPVPPMPGGGTFAPGSGLTPTAPVPSGLSRPQKEILGKQGSAAAFNREIAPYRERAEMFALSPDNKIYGGIWDNDKSFAVPGGGVDDGEDPAAAGAREFLEEAGMPVKNPRLLPIRSVIYEWGDNHRSRLPADKQKYRGARTHFVVGDIDPAGPISSKLDQWNVGSKGFYSLSDAIKQMEGKTPMSPDAFAARRKVLEYLFQRTFENTNNSKPKEDAMNQGNLITKAASILRRDLLSTIENSAAPYLRKLAEKSRKLTDEESADIEQSSSRWLPTIFQGNSSPIHSRLASPGKNGLILGGVGGLAGAGYGSLIGTLASSILSSDNKPSGVGTALGALIGGGAGAVGGYTLGSSARRAENDTVLDVIRHSKKPNPTNRDYYQDPSIRGRAVQNMAMRT